jgi:hypothetical protein
MARELRRRGVLRGLAVAGATGVAGCNFGESATSGGDGGSGSGTATREPLTWSEATREVLDQSDVQALQGTDLAPGTVESRVDGERTFAAVGWYRGASDLDSAEIQRIDALLARASETRGTLSEAESTLTRLDSLIQRMKSTTVPLTGVSVWEATTSLSPSLQGFDAALSRSLDEVRTWLSLLADVTGSLGDVRETIEAVRGGRIGQAVRLAEQTERGLSAVGNLESRSSSLRETLSGYARITGQVADVSGQLGRMAGEVGQAFGEASRQLERAASDLQQFNEGLRSVRSVLSDLRSRSRQRSSQLLSRAEELVGPGASADGGDTATSTPLPSTPTPTPTPQSPGILSDPEFVEDFEDGVGEWSGDTGQIEGATDAARGVRSVRLAPGYTTASLDLPAGTGETYSIWWKVESDSGTLQLTFQDREGTTGFGGAIQAGTRGLEVAVNPGFAGEEASATLYRRARAGSWYRLAFANVDFEGNTFEASLYDVGDAELTRIQQSFAGEVGDVARMTARNSSDDGGSYLDHLVVTSG